MPAYQQEQVDILIEVDIYVAGHQLRGTSQSYRFGLHLKGSIWISSGLHW